MITIDLAVLCLYLLKPHARSLMMLKESESETLYGSSVNRNKKKAIVDFDRVSLKLFHHRIIVAKAFCSFLTN